MSIEGTPKNDCGHDRYNDLCKGFALTPEVLAQVFIFNGKVYRRHQNGGGLVAFDAYVPDELGVDFDVMVHSGTRLLDDAGLAGIDSVSGNYTNGTVVSRVMNEDDWNEYFEQRDRRGLPTFEDDEEYAREQLQRTDISSTGY